MGSPTYQEPQKGNTEKKRGYNNGKRRYINNKSKKKLEKATGELKFQVHGQNVPQTVTYTKVLEHLIVKIQTTFDRLINIVKSLREKKKNAPDEPKRTRIKLEGTDNEKEQAAFDQQTCDTKFTQEWNTWQKVNGKFDEDWAKTYALIYRTYCRSEMRTVIKEDPRFETDIMDEPLRVLDAISTSMYTLVRVRYPFSTLAETLS